MSVCCCCFGDVHDKTSLWEYFVWDDVLCGACRKKLSVLKRWFTIEDLDVYGLYLYDVFMEALLFQYKECYDIALKDVFLYPFRKEIFDKFKGYTIIFMPSSEKKIKERGFLSLMEMFDMINLPKISPLLKKKDYKQKGRTMNRRKEIEEVMILNKNVALPDTPLLLVDDVCTSGATLLCAYHLLKHHPYPLKAFVCAVHPMLVE